MPNTACTTFRECCGQNIAGSLDCGRLRLLFAAFRSRASSHKIVPPLWTSDRGMFDHVLQLSCLRTRLQSLSVGKCSKPWKFHLLLPLGETGSLIPLSGSIPVHNSLGVFRMQHKSVRRSCRQCGTSIEYDQSPLVLARRGPRLPSIEAVFGWCMVTDSFMGFGP